MNCEFCDSVNDVCDPDGCKLVFLGPCDGKDPTFTLERNLGLQRDSLNFS
jgi:hypothetical protein